MKKENTLTVYFVILYVHVWGPEVKGLLLPSTILGGLGSSLPVSLSHLIWNLLNWLD